MIIRHDVDPALYRVDPAQFPAVIAIDSVQEELPIAYDNIDRMLKPSLIPEAQMTPEICDRTDGMGTLISPTWILTAAHVATELSPESTLKFLAAPYAIQQIVIHPDFVNWGDDNWGDSHQVAQNDIALIALTKPVRNVEPISLYSKTDELKKSMTFLGSGDFGNGLIGPDSVDAKLRQATNRVEEMNDEWLVFKFDAPPEGTDLEGISGPGDSGGPALLPVDDGWAIAGISAGQDSQGLGEGYYGVWEYYTRVSQYLDWIESVIAEKKT
ncbi:MAG: trypsin-like serine protease [Cyanobacteria bacterium J06560_5]